MKEIYNDDCYVIKTDRGEDGEQTPTMHVYMKAGDPFKDDEDNILLHMAEFDFMEDMWDLLRHLVDKLDGK